jgi:hypothetical protein
MDPGLQKDWTGLPYPIDIRWGVHHVRHETAARTPYRTTTRTVAELTTGKI